jgi:hypothetical protein
MSSAFPPNPQFAKDWKEWANQMVEYIQDRGQVVPQAVLLQHQTDSDISKATTDGILMYDPVSQQPVYARNGAWEPMVTESAFSDPAIYGGADLDVMVLSLTWTPVPLLNEDIPPEAGVYQIIIGVTLTGTNNNAIAQFRWVWDGGSAVGDVIAVGNRAEVFVSTTSFVNRGVNLVLEATGVNATILSGDIAITHIGYAP